MSAELQKQGAVATAEAAGSLSLLDQAIQNPMKCRICCAR